MPIAYLDVHEGIESEEKKVLVKGIHDAMRGVYPPTDHRIYVREWPFDSVSQDGQVGWERPRLVIQFLGPRLAIEAKRKMMKGTTAAIANAYKNPLDFAVFIQEYPDEQVAINGNLVSDLLADRK
jgi:phenylpyruvate tautomerase PptA (4-oxalocrotonate tautomerase family)